MSILNETQKCRNLELADLIDKSVEYVESLGIATPDSIRVYDEKKNELTKEEMLNLYKNYKYLDLDAYYKTLMFTSVKKRCKELYQLIRETNTKKVLDYGSGVGTHAISFLENNNEVHVLDVKNSPLLSFTVNRILARKYTAIAYDNESILPTNYYDVIICADVLEHVYDPMCELNKMNTALKKDGIIFLEVSNMVKPSSGHFKSSISKWKAKGIKFMKENYNLIRKNTWQKK